MINHRGLVLMSHPSLWVGGSPHGHSGFSVFKIVSHIHMRATVLSGLVKIADSAAERHMG